MLHESIRANEVQIINSQFIPLCYTLKKYLKFLLDPNNKKHTLRLEIRILTCYKAVMRNPAARKVHYFNPARVWLGRPYHFFDQNGAFSLY